MRFRAHIVDIKAIQLLSNVIATITNTVHTCVIHFSLNKVYFFMSEGSLSDQAFYCAINYPHMFYEYRCEETDGFPTELYLRVNISLLAEAFKSAQNPMELKIILQNKKFGEERLDTPCLTLTFPLPSMASKQKTTIHDLKVELISQKEWHLFQEPNMPQIDASIVLPDLKKIKIAVERLKKMSSLLRISADNLGHMSLKIETDCVVVKMSFQNIETIKCEDLDNLAPNEMKEVTIEIKKFLQILHSCFEPTRTICNIVSERALQVFVCLEDQVVFQYLLPAILP